MNIELYEGLIMKQEGMLIIKITIDDKQVNTIVPSECLSKALPGDLVRFFFLPVNRWKIRDEIDEDIPAVEYKRHFTKEMTT